MHPDEKIDIGDQLKGVMSETMDVFEIRLSLMSNSLNLAGLLKA
jgi:hypothetical protein